MTTRNCPRLWEVEAVRDGRVVGIEREEFGRHIQRCSDCRELAEGIEASARRLKELPSGLPDALALRRQRQALLQLADSSLMVPPAQRRRLPLIGLGIAAAMALLGLWYRRESIPDRWVEASPTSTGTWTEARSGGLDRVVLGDGHFGFTVHRPSASSRVVLALPDGEIEDVGTVLEVWIENGLTRHVAVQSGAVALRLRGAAAISLRAGEHWMRPATETAPSGSQHETTDPPAPVKVQSLTGSHDALAGEPSTATRRGSKPRAAPSPPPVSTLESGSTNVRDEDAAYLRVLNSLEAGRYDEARKAMDTYLTRYPLGFRRLEVLEIQQRLARAQGEQQP